MRKTALLVAMLTVVLILAAILVALPGIAQQVTGTLGSPSATTTIPGNQLPPPAPKFEGVIKKSVRGSVPWWPPRVVPPKSAPNVLLVLVDDSGFGTSSTFGGVIPSPTLDKLAANGLRYTAMHTTALCSPTRAALMSGRNHHSMGYGVVAEGATGYPGYDAIITLPRSGSTRSARCTSSTAAGTSCARRSSPTRSASA